VNRLKYIQTIHVRRRPDSQIHHGFLEFDGTVIPCFLGRSGISTNKHEGDGATPAGTYELLHGYYRKDRIKKPLSLLPFNAISRNHGWCDEPWSPNYNRLIRLPFNHSHEVMTRDDRLYDICIVLDHNIHPQIRQRGSAVFFHLTSAQQKPTQGCIAIDPDPMRRLLPLLSTNTRMVIHG